MDKYVKTGEGSLAQKEKGEANSHIEVSVHSASGQPSGTAVEATHTHNIESSGRQSRTELSAQASSTPPSSIKTHVKHWYRL